MKKIGIVLLIMLMLPVFVNAGSFDSEKGKANNYLYRDAYSNSYKKYLLYNNLNFGFRNGSSERNTLFSLGGFISEEEYKLTIPTKGSSYLLTGETYWTLTKNGSKYKVVEYTGENTNELSSYESDNTRPKARVTEFVNPNTSVSGTGRQNDPWIFEPMFRVDFKIVGGHATINGSTEDDGRELNNVYLRAKCKEVECTKVITLTIEEGFNYISDTCDGTFDYDNKTFKVNNITKDLECKINIGIGKFKVNLVKGDWVETKAPVPNTLYLRQRENYYRDTDYKNIIYKLDTRPERYGYTFKGYYIKDTTIKIIDETGTFIDKTSIKKNNQDIISDWQKNKYTITFNANGGTINVAETTKEVTFDEQYGLLPNATRAGYSFKGWFTSTTNNEQILATSIVKYAGNRTLYAQWTICPTGTYNTGNSTTCTSCPIGYTSAEGSTAENQCYMMVPAGKYLVAKASSSTNCAAGTYRNGAVTKYYGESVSCNDCLAGTYQNETGKTSCKNCPSGYTSSVKTTAENQCFITVPTGNKLIAKSTPSACEAGKYRNGAIVKKYGESISCTNCAANTYSTGGASSCTNCPSGYSVASGAGTAQNKCYVSVPAGKKLVANSTPTNCDTNTYRAGAVTKYYGESVSCIACPSGYGVAAGSGTAQTSCTMSVPAGKQLAKNASSATNCAANAWRSGPTTVAYGSSVSCTACPSGYSVAAGSGTAQSSCTISVAAGKQLAAKASNATNCAANTWRSGPTTVAYGNSVSCTACPSGYSVAAGSGTAQNKCTISVAAGRYLTAKASSTTACPAGQYRAGTVTKAYGESIGCLACGAGTYSNAGWGSCATCAAGTYSEAGWNGCATCPANTYSGAGWGGCAGCPSGSISGAGSSSCSGCSNGANVASWSSGCNIASCNAGYALSGNNCYSAVASNNVNGVTSYYLSVQEALNASTTGTTTLLVDREESVTLNSGYSKTYNINGHTMTGTVQNYGTMTINGGGTIVNTVNIPVVNRGTLTLNSLYVSFPLNNGAVAVDSQSSTIYINNSTIDSASNGLHVAGGSAYVNGSNIYGLGTTIYVCAVNVWASAYAEINNSVLKAAKDHGYVCNNNTCAITGCVEGVYDTPDPGNKVIVNWGAQSGGRGFYSRSTKAPVIQTYKKDDNTWVAVYHSKANITRCATWTTANGQDDLKWTNCSCSGEIYSGFDRKCTCTIKRSDHKNELGNYVMHFYNGNTFINDVSWNWP